MSDNIPNVIAKVHSYDDGLNQIEVSYASDILASQNPDWYDHHVLSLKSLGVANTENSASIMEAVNLVGSRYVQMQYTEEQMAYGASEVSNAVNQLVGNTFSTSYAVVQTTTPFVAGEHIYQNWMSDSGIESANAKVVSFDAESKIVYISETIGRFILGQTAYGHTSGANGLMTQAVSIPTYETSITYDLSTGSGGNFVSNTIIFQSPDNTYANANITANVLMVTSNGTTGILAYEVLTGEDLQLNRYVYDENGNNHFILTKYYSDANGSSDSSGTWFGYDANTGSGVYAVGELVFSSPDDTSANANIIASIVDSYANDAILAIQYSESTTGFFFLGANAIGLTSGSYHDVTTGNGM